MEEEKKKPTEGVDESDDDDIDAEDIDESSDGDDEADNGGSVKKKDEVDEKEMAERAKQAKARREREAKEKAQREKEIREKALLEGELSASSVNTYTNKPIKDEYDLKVFKLQKEIEAAGGDPVADLPSKLAEIDRKQGDKAKKDAEAQKEKQDYMTKDIEGFRSAYPKVNLQKLLQDPDFKDYSDGKLGNRPLTEIYKAFEEFKKRYSKPKEEKKEEGTDNGVPSPNGGRKQAQTSYSKMSEAEKIAELRKQGLIR